MNSSPAEPPPIRVTIPGGRHVYLDNAQGHDSMARPVVPSPGQAGRLGVDFLAAAGCLSTAADRVNVAALILAVGNGAQAREEQADVPGDVESEHPTIPGFDALATIPKGMVVTAVADFPAGQMTDRSVLVAAGLYHPQKAGRLV